MTSCGLESSLTMSLPCLQPPCGIGAPKPIISLRFPHQRQLQHSSTQSFSLHKEGTEQRIPISALHLCRILPFSSLPCPSQVSRQCCTLERFRHGHLRVITRAVPCERSSSKETASVSFSRVAFEPNVVQELGDVVAFEEGRSPEHIRAAAYLRALCFYTYPEGRAEEALKVFLLHQSPQKDFILEYASCM